MEINEKLDAALLALRQDMTDTLARWVRVPSVRAEKSAPNAPFGADVRRILDVAMADIARLGLTPRDVDGYACDAEIGRGEETVAVLAHLDVVPAGDGWTHDPFGAAIEGDRLYGRGAGDDKGPAVAALFAMRALLDAGVPLGKRCRLILGCDEESGMEDLQHYERAIGLPEKGFSPDADFPVINTEKGILGMSFAAPMEDARLLALDAGTRRNIVPGAAQALLRGDWRAQAADAFDAPDDVCEIEASLEGGDTRIRVTGVPAHASMPGDGRNAAKMLLRVLARIGVGGAAVALLDEAVGDEDAGVALGIAGRDEVSGALTINLGLLSLEEGTLRATFDCRYPVFFSGDAIVHTVSARLAPARFALTERDDSAPHHVPASSPLVQRLVEVYRALTGEDGAPFAIGGGTYARHLKEGVAFGMLFPGEPELAHQAEEYVSLESPFKAARIYAYAIAALCA